MTIFGGLRIRYFVWGLAIAIALYFAAIPIRLSAVRSRVPQPQAILVLGGDPEREMAAAYFAAQHPSLNIWISTGQVPTVSKAIFRQANVDSDRLHLDYQAVDTVTNFTTTVHQFKRRNIQHIYIITTDFHMRRARAIAFLVLGTRGIAYTPVSVPSSQASEPLLKVTRDVGRSLLWLVTGKTGASVGTSLKASK